MGMTFVEVVVKNRVGLARTVRFLVDSGTGYSVLPREDWTALQLAPEREVSVSLADGTLLERKASQCEFVFRGIQAFSPVILGEAGDEALLGAVTLENLGLVLDPLRRELQPMKLRA